MSIISAYSRPVTKHAHSPCALEYACFCQDCSASEAVTQTDCDCDGGRKCNEASCVPRTNNQHPSEGIGRPRIRGISVCVSVCAFVYVRV